MTAQGGEGQGVESVVGQVEAALRGEGIDAGIVQPDAGRPHEALELRSIERFGLLGHALELAGASGVTVSIETSRVPLIAGVRDLAAMGMIPAGSFADRKFCERAVAVDDGVDPLLVDLLADAQTSGGLLISVAGPAGDELHAALERRGVPHHEIGRVAEPGPGRIRVAP